MIRVLNPLQYILKTQHIKHHQVFDDNHDDDVYLFNSPSLPNPINPNPFYLLNNLGFSNMYQSRNRAKAGARFSDLLLNVANISPDLRVRFTSPHPKDFPEDVLAVVGIYVFLCIL